MTGVRTRVHSIYSGLQTRLGNTDACLFLSLCSIIHECRERAVDILGLASHAVVEGWIREDYYVRDALAILKYATGRNWKVEAVKELPPTLGKHSYTIVKWFNPRTGFTHFTRRYVDTLVNSVTVAEGHIEEYRIYTRI